MNLWGGKNNRQWHDVETRKNVFDRNEAEGNGGAISFNSDIVRFDGYKSVGGEFLYNKAENAGAIWMEIYNESPDDADKQGMNRSFYKEYYAGNKWVVAKDSIFRGNEMTYQKSCNTEINAYYYTPGIYMGTYQPIGTMNFAPKFIGNTFDNNLPQSCPLFIYEGSLG